MLMEGGKLEGAAHSVYSWHNIFYSILGSQNSSFYYAGNRSSDFVPSSFTTAIRYVLMIKSSETYLRISR